MDPKKIMMLNNITNEEKAVLLEMNNELNRLIAFVRNFNNLNGERSFDDLITISS